MHIKSKLLVVISVFFIFFPISLSQASNWHIIKVTITAYNPVKSQTDDTPNITASNGIACDGIIALSRNLEKNYNFKFGDLITIYNIGVFKFEDRMNKRWKNRVDILMMKNKDAKKFGEQTGWIILRR